MRVTEQGEIIASKYSDPISAPQLETLVAATLEASSSASATARRYDVMDGCRRTRTPRIADRYDTRLRRLLRGTRRRNRRSQHRQPASRTMVAAEKTCVRSRGCSAGMRRLMLPGWYGSERRSMRCRVRRAGRGRGSLRREERWPFFAAYVEHGDGAREDRSCDRVALRGRSRRRPTRSSPHRGRTIVDPPPAGDHGKRRPAVRQSTSRAAPEPIAHLVRSITRSSCCAVRGVGRPTSVRRAIHLITGLAAGLRNSG